LWLAVVPPRPPGCLDHGSGCGPAGREKLAGLQCPKEIRVVRRIPLNPNGSVNMAEARRCSPCRPRR